MRDVAIKVRFLSNPPIVRFLLASMQVTTYYGSETTKGRALLKISEWLFLQMKKHLSEYIWK